MMRGLFVSVIALFLLSACATPLSRSEKYAEAFTGLSEGDKALVLEGKIREGLPADGVLIALGKPSKVNKGVRKGSEELYWVYSRLVTYTIPSHHYAHLGCRNDVILSRVYSPHFITRSEDEFEVILQGGHVIGWRDL
ncbi:MAG: hypothetical protein AAGA18_10200 [Verrucomicrobiota bacterium]